MKPCILIFALMSLLITGLGAQPIAIGTGFTESLISQPEYLVTTAKFEIGDVFRERFGASPKPQIHLRTGESVWLRFELASSASQRVPLMARYEFPWTDRAEFFVVRKDGTTAAHTIGGDAVEGKRYERLPLAHFDIAAGEQLWLYLRVTTVAHTPSLIHLYHQDTLTPRVFLELLAQGLFIGIAVMLLIFHFNLYFATRDQALLGYLLYLTAVGFFMPLRSGVLPQMIFGSRAHLSDAVSVVMASACYFTGVSFVRRFFSLRLFLPRIDRWVFCIQWLTLAPVCALLFGRREAFIAENLAGLLVGPPLLLLGIHQALQKRDQALYFVAGYSLPIVAAIIDNLVENGVLPHFAGRNEMLPAAMALEFLFFALIIYRKFADSELAWSRDKERLSRVRAELAFARGIQKSLIPPLQQKFGSLAFCAAYRSEKDVGSDYFDVVKTGEDTIGVLVTDTGTHRTSSLASALDASAVRMAFRNSFAGLPEPREVVARMFKLLEPVTRARPVAFTYIAVNTTTGAGTVYNHMNPSPILVQRAGGRAKIFESEGVHAPDLQSQFTLNPGDHLIALTAGVARRMNLLRDSLSPAHRIQKIQNRPQRQKLRRTRRAKEDLTMVALGFEAGRE